MVKIYFSVISKQYWSDEEIIHHAYLHKDGHLTYLPQLGRLFSLLRQKTLNSSVLVGQGVIIFFKKEF